MGFQVYLIAGSTKVESFAILSLVAEIIVPDTAAVDGVVVHDSTLDEVLETHAFRPVRVMGV